MNLSLLYTACVIGAAGLYLLVRPGARSLRIAGAIVALGALAWLVAGIPEAVGMSADGRPSFFFWIFALISVASAGRMITHPRPVYSALYFIMVVLSAAALLLLLGAEFMAFALIIVYAGAILVTYLFVIMLAQQADNPDDPAGSAEYDRVPREPAAAAVAGLLVMAALSQLALQPNEKWPDTSPSTYVRRDAWYELDLMPKRLEKYIAEQTDGEFTLGWPEEQRIVTVNEDASEAWARYTTADNKPLRMPLPESILPENIHRVGLALVWKFPVSLEVAGVILLMAMLGAVVLARRQVELGEDELRRAVGMRGLPVDRGDESEGASRSPGNGGRGA